MYPFLSEKQHELRDGSLEVESLASHKLISFAQWTKIVHRRVHQYLRNQPPQVTFPQEEGDDFEEGDVDSLEGDDDDDFNEEEEWVQLPNAAAQHHSGGHGGGGRGGQAATYQRKTISSQRKNRAGVRGAGMGGAGMEGGGGGGRKGDHLFQLHPRPASQQFPTRGAKSSVTDAAQARQEALHKVGGRLYHSSRYITRYTSHRILYTVY